MLRSFYWFSKHVFSTPIGAMLLRTAAFALIAVASARLAVREGVDYHIPTTSTCAERVGVCAVQWQPRC